MSTSKNFTFLLTGLLVVSASYWLFFSSESSEPQPVVQQVKKDFVAFPEVDRIKEFFNLANPKFPIVETVTYTSRAPWQKGKAAWVADYANHFKTSRHFIARSLNQKPEYAKQVVKEGDQFNVLKIDSNFTFHLLVDLSSLKLLFYYVDEAGLPTFVKSYPVAVGRPNAENTSGFLTPTGTYTLGEKVAIYDDKKVGFYQGEKTELIKIYGTRWIPFEKEVKDCTAPAKGLGIHGTPWIQDPFTKDLREDTGSIGSYSSDGCIRLKTADMEELFSIIVSRPTEIEIVQNYKGFK